MIVILTIQPAFVIRWTFIKNIRAKRKDHELFFNIKQHSLIEVNWE